MSKNSSKELVDQLKQWLSWLKFSTKKPENKKVEYKKPERWPARNR
jgi:hypothetical protein